MHNLIIYMKIMQSCKFKKQGQKNLKHIYERHIQNHANQIPIDFKDIYMFTY